MEKAGMICGIALALLLIWIMERRARCRRKVQRMGREEKISLLNELTGPFGFLYDPVRDIFVSKRDAWQRQEGYEELFDRLAVNFNMVLDAFPVYFDYRDKTWLIEFWKGQYGINTGAEAGIYHAGRLVPKERRRKIRYHAVSDEEMPLIGVCLEKNGQMLFCNKERHWWLASFRTGLFSEPSELSMQASVTFHDAEAAQAFAQGLKEAGLAESKYRKRGRKVSVRLDQSLAYFGRAGFRRKIAQAANRIFCSLYLVATKPFVQTPDRALFLYEQFPWCIRYLLRAHPFGRKARARR